MRDLEQQHNRDFCNVLSGLVPRSMVPVLIARTEIPAHTKANAVTRQQRWRLLEQLKRFELTVTGPGPIEQAIITSGRRQNRRNSAGHYGIQAGARLVFCRGDH